MPQGRQVEVHRQAEAQGRAHRRELRESRGVPEQEAEARAWATVNKESGGGNKSGSGRGEPDTKVSSKKGGKNGGAASASQDARATLRLRQEGRRDPQEKPGGEGIVNGL